MQYTFSCDVENSSDIKLMPDGSIVCEGGALQIYPFSPVVGQMTLEEVDLYLSPIYELVLYAFFLGILLAFARHKLI